MICVCTAVVVQLRQLCRHEVAHVTAMMPTKTLPGAYENLSSCLLLCPLDTIAVLAIPDSTLVRNLRCWVGTARYNHAYRVV